MRIHNWIKPSDPALAGPNITVMARTSVVEHGPREYAERLAQSVEAYGPKTWCLQNIGWRYHPDHGDVVEEGEFWRDYLFVVLDQLEKMNVPVPRFIVFDVEGHWGAAERLVKERHMQKYLYGEIWKRWPHMQVANFHDWKLDNGQCASPHLYHAWDTSLGTLDDMPQTMRLIPWIATPGPMSAGTYHRDVTVTDLLDYSIMAIRQGASELIWWGDPANVHDEELYWSELRRVAELLQEDRG